MLGQKAISLLVALVIFIPQFTFAISGACSWHGGISCSLGSDTDGSVICNDGWRDSSVSYRDASECKNNISLNDICTPPGTYWSGCSSDSTVTMWRNQCEKEKSTQQTLIEVQGVPSKFFSEPASCVEAKRCEESVRKFKEAEAGYSQCVDSAYAFQKQTISQTSEKISCKEGYIPTYSGQCVTPQTWCTGEYGVSSVYRETKENASGRQVISCGCIDGFQFDSSDKCVRVASSKTPTSTVSEAKEIERLKKLVQSLLEILAKLQAR